jgi:hypothetical protein
MCRAFFLPLGGRLPLLPKQPTQGVSSEGMPARGATALMKD